MVKSPKTNPISTLFIFAPSLPTGRSVTVPHVTTETLPSISGPLSGMPPMSFCTLLSHTRRSASESCTLLSHLIVVLCSSFNQVSDDSLLCSGRDAHGLAHSLAHPELLYLGLSRAASPPPTPSYVPVVARQKSVPLTRTDMPAVVAAMACSLTRVLFL